MPARTVDVEWEVAADERFTHVVQRGMAATAPELGHSVHVELTGLQPAQTTSTAFVAKDISHLQDVRGRHPHRDRWRR